MKEKKKGYEMALKIRGDEAATVIFTNVKTKEIVCIMDDNNGKTKVYGANKKLIAEGESEADEPSKIYDNAAYKKCEKVAEIFDDEDD